MIEHIVGYVLKAITYYHLLLKICTCGTIRGCATIKINYGNKVICTRIVTHWATSRICATNRVNTVSDLRICIYVATSCISKIMQMHVVWQPQ